MDQHTTTKKCTGCGETKTTDNFPKNRIAKCGFGSKCYPCQNAAARDSYHRNKKARRARANERRSNPEVKLRIAHKSREAYMSHQKVRKKAREYGITTEKVKELLSGLCDICGGAPDPQHVGTAQRTLHIDHDHATNKVRGGLCHSCNAGLGRFKDNPSLLRAAAAYLEHFMEKEKA